MEKGESSQQQQQQPQRQHQQAVSHNIGEGLTYRNSAATLATLANVERRRRPSMQAPGSKRVIYDSTYPGYGWLLPGWLAEERYMESGRIYRYYYDPEGNLYRSQEEVVHAWEESGLIVIDK